MRTHHTPSAGPISVTAAIESLTLTLNAHPMLDIAIIAWAAERQSIMATQRKLEQTGADWLRRFGEINPTQHVVIGEPMPPTYVPPQARNGRPREARMDAANALLLRAHPVLRRAPLHFAMLEALYGVDALETVRFPSPKTWADNPERAVQQRHTVYCRAEQRITRALELVSAPMVEHASNLVGVDYERNRE
jgi:hypothetical protein